MYFRHEPSTILSRRDQTEASFITPALPEDLDLLSWPLTYIRYDVSSIDGKEHQVRLLLKLLPRLRSMTLGKRRFGHLLRFPVSRRKLSDLSHKISSIEVAMIFGSTGDIYISAPADQHPKWDSHQLVFSLDNVGTNVFVLADVGLRRSVLDSVYATKPSSILATKWMGAEGSIAECSESFRGASRAMRAI